MTFTTIEAVDYRKSVVVRDVSGRHLAPLSRDQLLLSLHASLQHRPTALEDAAGLCDTIISKAISSADHGVLDVRTLMHTAFVALNRFDKLAAQHYQAMHKM
jgi:transcriptional regulator NrdR family protein